MVTRLRDSGGPVEFSAGFSTTAALSLCSATVSVHHKGLVNKFLGRLDIPVDGFRANIEARVRVHMRVCVCDHDAVRGSSAMRCSGIDTVGCCVAGDVAWWQWFPLLGKSNTVDKPRGDLRLLITWDYDANPVDKATMVCICEVCVDVYVSTCLCVRVCMCVGAARCLRRVVVNTLVAAVLSVGAVPQ